MFWPTPIEATNQPTNLGSGNKWWVDQYNEGFQQHVSSNMNNEIFTATKLLSFRLLSYFFFLSFFFCSFFLLFSLSLFPFFSFLILFLFDPCNLLLFRHDFPAVSHVFWVLFFFFWIPICCFLILICSCLILICLFWSLSFNLAPRYVSLAEDEQISSKSGPAHDTALLCKRRQSELDMLDPHHIT